MDITGLVNQSTKQPKTILRIVISVSIGLLVLWIFLVSRMELPTQRESVLVSTDSTRQVAHIRNNLLGEEQPQTELAEANQNQSPIFQNAFTTFFIMVTVLGGLWLWSSKKKKKIETTNHDIKEVAHHIIGQGVQLKIIELNDEVWVLGVSANAVNLLHRYPKDKWQPPNKQGTEPELSDSDFNSIYKMLGK